MKDTRPIEVQVASLTDKQKWKIPKIYAFHLAFSIALVGFLLLFLLICQIRVMNLQAEAEAILPTYEYYYTRVAAYEALDAAVSLRTIVAIVGGISTILLSLGVQLYITKKYPFYSEKKYHYLKKAAQQG